MDLLLSLLLQMFVQLFIIICFSVQFQMLHLALSRTVLNIYVQSSDIFKFLSHSLRTPENGINSQFNVVYHSDMKCTLSLLLVFNNEIPVGGRHNICGWPNCFGSWDHAVGGWRSEEAMSVGLASCWENCKGNGSKYTAQGCCAGVS